MNFCRFYNKAMTKMYKYLNSKDDGFEHKLVKEIGLIEGILSLILTFVFVAFVCILFFVFRIIDGLKYIYSKWCVSRCDLEEK